MIPFNFNATKSTTLTHLIGYLSVTDI